MPAGVVNIVTGERDALAKTLAEHDDVDALWYRRPAEGSAAVESGLGRQPEARPGSTTASAATGCRDAEGQGRDFLRHATQVKNIWVPYGE